MSSYSAPGVYVEEVASPGGPIVGAGTSVAAILGVYVDDALVAAKVAAAKVATDTAADAAAATTRTTPPADAATIDAAKARALDAAKAATDATTAADRSIASNGKLILVTNLSEFRSAFGGFSSLIPELNQLAHAVYGFFLNGGTRCYVGKVTMESALPELLALLETKDEVSLVLAPGITSVAAQAALIAHCTNMKDRFAILDSPKTVGLSDIPTLKPGSPPLTPGASSFAAYYFPWIQVADPASSSNIYVPPSGHLAGLYARVDAQRGVHKAPANEVVLGALDVQYPVSQAKQEILNPVGINCIRRVNGNIMVWGARTFGGDGNGEFKYIGSRRLFCFLRDSITAGLQWAVFEPNTPELWARISRDASAFLTSIWKSGALFGATPKEAFSVKCDAELNPPDQRGQGRVVTQIGVALTQPAEFVIFQIGQRQPTN